MARFETSGLDETIKDMQRMRQLTGTAAEAMLISGAAVVREHWQASAKRHGHMDSGDMIASIRAARKVKDIGGMKAIDVYPQGKDYKGTRNAEKAFILNYGTTKIKASRWVKEAEKSAEAPATQAMIRIWDTFIETGRVPAAAPRGR